MRRWDAFYFCVSYWLRFRWSDGVWPRKRFFVLKSKRLPGLPFRDEPVNAFWCVPTQHLRDREQNSGKWPWLVSGSGFHGFARYRSYRVLMLFVVWILWLLSKWLPSSLCPKIAQSDLRWGVWKHGPGEPWMVCCVVKILRNWTGWFSCRRSSLTPPVPSDEVSACQVFTY